jgi:hypothetical protein
VVDFLSDININSHQWLLEYASLQQKGEMESDHTNKNLDALTTASFELEQKLGAYVVENIS